jgi:prohibitin 1
MGWIIFGLFLGIAAVVANFLIVAFVNDGNEFAIRDGRKQPLKVNKGLVVASFLAPLLICTAIASSARVGTGEIAVMTRFGKVTGQELGEGFHLKNPFDVAHIYDIKVQKIEADAAAASKDLQDVKTKLVINYQLEGGKVSEIHRTVGELYKEKVIDNAVQEVVKGATAKFDATQMITDRPAVKAEAFNTLKDRLSKYGIDIRDLSITNFEFSPEFAQAIESKQVAQQEAQRAIFVAEKAKQEAQADIERARGQAESQRLLTSTASEQSIELKRLEVQQAAIAKWNGALPTTSLGSDSNFLLNLQGGR